MLLIPVINSRDDTESVAKDVARSARSLPKPDGEPGPQLRHRASRLRRRPQRGGRGHGRDAAGDHGVLVLVLMLLTYRSPLIAALMLGVVAIAYLIATGAGLRPGGGRR